MTEDIKSSKNFSDTESAFPRTFASSNSFVSLTDFHKAATKLDLEEMIKIYELNPLISLDQPIPSLHVTPLQLAINADSSDIALWLLEQNPDLTIKKEDHIKLLTWALDNNKNNLFIFLFNKLGPHLIETTELLITKAIANNCEKIAIMLVKSLPDSVFEYGAGNPRRWMISAAEKHQVELINLLVQLKADPFMYVNFQNIFTVISQQIKQGNPYSSKEINSIIKNILAQKYLREDTQSLSLLKNWILGTTIFVQKNKKYPSQLIICDAETLKIINDTLTKLTIADKKRFKYLDKHKPTAALPEKSPDKEVEIAYHELNTAVKSMNVFDYEIRKEKILTNAKKCNVNAFVNNKTPLFRALENFKNNPENQTINEKILVLILNQNANPFVKNDKGQNAFDFIKQLAHGDDSFRKKCTVMLISKLLGTVAIKHAVQNYEIFEALAKKFKCEKLVDGHKKYQELKIQQVAESKAKESKPEESKPEETKPKESNPLSQFFSEPRITSSKLQKPGSKDFRHSEFRAFHKELDKINKSTKTIKEEEIEVELEEAAQNNPC